MSTSRYTVYVNTATGFTYWAGGDESETQVCGIRDTGEWVCWGENAGYTPTTIDAGPYDKLAIGPRAGCARLENSTEYRCRGALNFGQTGEDIWAIDRDEYFYADWANVRPAGFGPMDTVEMEGATCGQRETETTFECPSE